jgi:arsenate reductase
MLRDAGIEPTITEYLSSPPARAELAEMIRGAGIGVRDAMRSKEALYTQLGLSDPALDDAQLLDAMISHPVLINRPFVQTPLGTRLCRPKELLHEILT